MHLALEYLVFLVFTGMDRSYRSHFIPGSYVEKRYTATEIECLAVLSAIKHFEVYLHGIKFTVETDHKALEQLLSSNHLNARLTRWALYLQQFSMTIHYRPGSKNQNADGLSRQAWNTVDEDVAHFEKGGDVRM